ncbi:MAG: PEGA domain-containing protein [Acidobacteria bacterium]|nr:PEGA domain-containing protein [Acidobacteriota bacterium]
MIPEKIGRYIIEGELGRGAMGQVYRAHDPNIGRRLAIKTIPFDSGNPEMRGRFQREAQAAGRLAHPNIVTIFDAGEEQGVLYIAMELVEGQSLSEVLASGPVNFAQAISIGQQIAAGLAHAHGQGIVHRDIKPANIMIAAGVAGSVVKIMDFGVARLASSGFTATGQMLGTPAYLPPEVIRGEPADSRSDIFSLGIVLYECLTGVRPFNGDNISAVMFQVLTLSPTSPHQVIPQVPLALSAVVMKAIEKQPFDRFQSCNELHAALEQCHAENSAFHSGTTAELSHGTTVRSAIASVAAKPMPTMTTATLAVGDSRTQATQSTLAPQASLQPVVLTSGLKWQTATAVAAGLVLVASIGFWKMRQSSSPPLPGSSASSGAAPDGTTGVTTGAPALRQPAQTMPPPPPPPARITGTVQIRSTPPGASITVNNQEIAQRTPANVELTPGYHKVRVELEGYSGQNRDVTIEAGENFLLNIEMKKGGFLRRVNPF